MLLGFGEAALLHLLAKTGSSAASGQIITSGGSQPWQGEGFRSAFPSPGVELVCLQINPCAMTVGMININARAPRQLLEE